VQNGPDFDGYFGTGLALKRAIKKYGIENFVRETLQICNDEKELNEIEDCWIEKLKSQYKLYNIAKGGCGGNLGEKVNKKISRKKKRWHQTHDFTGKNNSNYGNKWTEQQKEHARKIHLGTKQSKSTIEKRRQKNLGKKRAKDFCGRNSEWNRDLVKNGNHNFQKLKGTIFVNNGLKTIRIPRNKLEEYTNLGYKKGRIISWKT